MKRLCAALLALLVGNHAMASDIEEPTWILVDTIEDVELRDYAPTVRATTRLDNADQSGSGFQRLAGFIFGGNETGERIAMTAPVEETLYQDAPTMAFTMPSGYSLEDLPQPNDASVVLESMPGRTLAAIRFSGWATSGKISRKTEQLMQTLAQNGIATVGDPALNQYNPPWTPPFLRRNEITVEVQLPQADS